MVQSVTIFFLEFRDTWIRNKSKVQNVPWHQVKTEKPLNLLSILQWGINYFWALCMFDDSTDQWPLLFLCKGHHFKNGAAYIRTFSETKAPKQCIFSWNIVKQSVWSYFNSRIDIKRQINIFSILIKAHFNHQEWTDKRQNVDVAVFFWGGILFLI